MTWGSLMFYYHCPKCGMKFEYAMELMPEFGEKFGFCPECDVPGVYEKEGARQFGVIASLPHIVLFFGVDLAFHSVGLSFA